MPRWTFGLLMIACGGADKASTIGDSADTETVAPSPSDTDAPDPSTDDTDPPSGSDSDPVADTDGAGGPAGDTDPAGGGTDTAAWPGYDTGVVAAIDTGVGGGQGCPDDAWWPGADLDGDGQRDLVFRVWIDVAGGATSLAPAPIFADVDLAAALAAVNAGASYDPASLRLVRQDCTAGFPEIPSQLIERLVDLPRKAPHLDADGNGRGTLAFVHDLDGDLATVDALAPGDSASYALYFTTLRRSGGGIASPSYPTDLVTTPDQILNANTTASLSAAGGGLLSALTWNGSPTLTSQTESCCGNGIYMAFPPGWLDPQDNVADAVEVLASGPIVGAVRASGIRAAVDLGVPVGSYQYDVVYWMVTGRPELYYSTTQRTLMDTLNEHPDDGNLGFRFWESRQQQLAATGALTYQQDRAQGWASVTGPAWGIAFGLAHPPTYLTEVYNPLLRATGQPFVDYLAFVGNDWQPGPFGSPMTIPANTTYFDSVDMVLWPYAGSFGAVRDQLLGVQAFLPSATGAVTRVRP